MDKEKLASSLMQENNLDDAEKETISSLVEDSIEIVKRSVGTVNEADPLYWRAVKTQATLLYYDRTGERGTSRGLLSMLAKLQASQGGGQFGEKVQTC